MLSSQKERALGLLGASGMLRLKDFIAEGIEPETLARLVREQRVIRPARGLYQLPDAPIDAAHMLIEASVLVPKGIICLISALQFHALTLQMPSAVWMAIERTAWKPTISYPPIDLCGSAGHSCGRWCATLSRSIARNPRHESLANGRRLLPLPQ